MNKEINNNIKDKDYRTFLGLNKDMIKKIAKSQDEVIEKCNLGINRTTLSNYINGVSIPPVDILLKLCAQIDCYLDDLVIPYLYENRDARYARIKKVTYLNQDGTYGPMKINMFGLNIYNEFDTRKVLNPNGYDYCHYSVFYMTYDSYLLGTQKGAYILTDFEDDIFELSKEKDEMYVLLKEHDRLFPSLIKKCKDEMKISNIRADIYSYTDINGKTQIATINQLNPKIHSKIVKAIKEF